MKFFLVIGFCVLLVALVAIKTFTVKIMQKEGDTSQSKVLGWRSY